MQIADVHIEAGAPNIQIANVHSDNNIKPSTAVMVLQYLLRG